MFDLYLRSLLLKIRRRGNFFWSLMFPVILGTLFYVSFGGGVDLEQMHAIPVALVSQGDRMFETFLKSMKGEMLTVTEMEEAEALKALENDEVQGIFYSGKEPALTVASSNISESILASLLDGYVTHRAMLEEIQKENPARLLAAAAGIADYRGMLENVAVSGESMDTNVGYFYALIAMACLFGVFMGMDSSVEMRADQSALALRRSVTPVHRLKLVVSEMLAVFTVQFMCVCALLLYLQILGISFGERWPLLLPVCALGSMTGVAIGIVIGSMRWREGVKVAVLVSVSMAMSFLSGLMFVNMKDIVEHHMPLLNRVNPAVLIADAFYSVSVYMEPARYIRSLLILAAITIALTAVSFLRLRRERYAGL